MTTFALITPIDPVSQARVQVRVCSSQDRKATGAAGHRWIPAMMSQPVLSMQFFDGDFTSGVSPAQARIAVSTGVLSATGDFPGLGLYDWAGAGATLFRMVGDDLVLLAEMRVRAFAAEDGILGLDMTVDQEPFEADVLFLKYAGTTGAEGGADLNDRPKPWAFGRCLNVEPVFIDQIDNVFQVSGYGPVSAIPAVYERGASFGASLGDFASYAALVAADIPEGRWGTCLAQGMFRLGAPPAGVITCDVDGDSTSGFRRRTGAVLSEIARRLNLSHRISAASLAALDAAVPFDINIMVSEQITLLELAQQMAAPCNAVAGLGFDGKLIMPRIGIGTPSLTLDAQGRQMPPVLGVARQNTSPPYSEIKIGAARSWRVHSFDEIAFFADLIDRGLYDNAATYREGNIVQSLDKSSWVYVNPAPSTGNAPPTWPTASNAFWSNLSPPASADPAVANTSIVINGDGEIEGIGTGAGTPVDNGRVQLSGLQSERPGGGGLVYVGLQWASTDTGEVSRWTETAPGVFEWVTVADITTAAIRTIEPEFPTIEIRIGEAGNVGTRTVTHAARRGTVTITGGVWSIEAETAGVAAGTATIDSATGTISLSGIALSGSYTVRYVHTDGIPTEQSVNVTYIPSNGSIASSVTKPFSTTSFTAMSNPLVVQLPTGVTEVELVADAISLRLANASPDGVTNVEAKWQRETSPGTWADVGSAVSASPHPLVEELTDPAGFFRTRGQISVNVTATGLTAGTQQTFRLVARITGGNTRTVTPSGTVTAGA